MQAPSDLKQKSQHGTWIEIRKDRLLQNLDILKSHLSARTDILAVVKANAYGHGLADIARTLDGKVSHLGVSSLSEARELKDCGIQTPIFMFGRLRNSELKQAITDKLTLSVSSFEEAHQISELSPQSEKTKVHVKVDTGMGRLGIPYRRALEVIEKMAALPSIDLEGIYTHFPSAEEDVFTNKQLYDFSLLLRALEQKEITFKYRHASNSTATLKFQTPLSNLVRPGLMLYGIYPESSLRQLAEVSPILSLKSRIMMLKRLRPGETVGYGRDFVAEKPCNIATLPIGYSHGYPFRLSNKAYVLYRGQRFPIAGRVSMDYLSINFGDCYAELDDEVTLIGEDGDETIYAEELASWAGTIPYEIVTQLSSRLPRLCQ